jgi:hypothetical protein
MLCSGGEGIVWRTGRDRLSGSRAVCHSLCRRCITCRHTRSHVCGCAAGFRGGVYEQSVRWVTASVPASDTTVESWHRFCSFTGTGHPPQYRGRAVPWQGSSSKIVRPSAGALVTWEPWKGLRMAKRGSGPVKLRPLRRRSRGERRYGASSGSLRRRGSIRGDIPCAQRVSRIEHCITQLFGQGP